MALRAELDATITAAAETLRDAARQADTARHDLAENLARQHRAELDAALAKADAETTRAQLRADAAQELAESHIRQIARLDAQVDDLRAELRRARPDT
jgi:hypothetical protein